jgi:hypothetical protein
MQVLLQTFLNSAVDKGERLALNPDVLTQGKKGGKKHRRSVEK